MLRRLIYLLPLLLLAACIKPPVFPNEPVITYEGISKTMIDAAPPNGNLDSLLIQLSFTDGDGDLTFSSNDSIDVFFFDSRLQFAEAPFILPLSLPSIPGEGTSNGISGDIFITMENEAQAICCISNGTYCPDLRIDPNIPETDTFSYAIQIRDRAGNVSNKVRTDLITINSCRGQ